MGLLSHSYCWLLSRLVTRKNQVLAASYQKETCLQQEPKQAYSTWQPNRPHFILQNSTLPGQLNLQPIL